MSSIRVEESEEGGFGCGVHVGGVGGNPGEHEHVLVVSDPGGLEQEPHEELVRHVRKTLLLGFLISGFKI